MGDGSYYGFLLLHGNQVAARKLSADILLHRDYTVPNE